MSAPRASSRPRPAVVLLIVVAAVVLASLAGLLLGGSGSGGGDDGAVGAAAGLPDAGPSDQPPQPAPTAALTTPTPQSSVPAPTPAALPVFVRKDDGAGYRLYRELRTARATGGLARAAVEQLTRPPTDPDYRSAWAGARVLSLRASGGVRRVEFAAPPGGPPTGEGVDSAVQQVVYTLAEVEQDPGLLVDVVVDGRPLGPSAVGRDSPGDVQGLVWVSEPTEGASVTGTVELAGVAAVSPAGVGWEVSQGDRVIRRGTAAEAPTTAVRAAWRAEVELPPGNYLVRAFVAGEGGGEGERAEDSKSLTVR